MVLGGTVISIWLGWQEGVFDSTELGASFKNRSLTFKRLGGWKKFVEFLRRSQQHAFSWRDAILGEAGRADLVLTIQ